jgi:hypothetical protein
VLHFAQTRLFNFGQSLYSPSPAGRKCSSDILGECGPGYMQLAISPF